MKKTVYITVYGALDSATGAIRAKFATKPEAKAFCARKNADAGARVYYVNAMTMAESRNV